MHSLVDEELDRLVQSGVIGVIEPVEYSNWAAPIVPILKSDQKSVRICGDFKLTVHQAAKVDRYLIPKIEDLFVLLSGRKVYSKPDLSHAYQQVEHSKKLLIITMNTPKSCRLSTHRKGCFITSNCHLGCPQHLASFNASWKIFYMKYLMLQCMLITSWFQLLQKMSIWRH